MKNNMNDISIIVPIFNEQHNIEPLLDHTCSVLFDTFSKITFIFVDDGSKDDTENKFLDLKKKDDNVIIKYIKLSRNYGKDLAIKCGIDHVNSKLCAIMDGDLQHPPEKILTAFDKIKQGFNIVHIVKKENTVESKFRRLSSTLFNKLINFLSETEIHLTDFKLLDYKAIKVIQSFKEANFFNRGIVDLIGLKAGQISYEPLERQFGESRYSFIRLVNLAVDSLVSVSVKPLRIAIHFGITISILSFLYAIFIIYEKIFLGQPIPGFATLATALFFLGGIQLLFLGIIGEYLGKTFIESKRRPQYIIDYINEL